MHIKEVVIYENNKIGNPDLLFIRVMIQLRCEYPEKTQCFMMINKWQINSNHSINSYFGIKLQMSTIRRHTVTHIPHQNLNLMAKNMFMK